MIPELGHFALLLALGLALALFALPALGVWQGNRRLMGAGASIAAGLLAFTGASFACLLHSFVTDDFSVIYVARNSNSALPMQYKASALWGAHEGSFLLWTLVMAGWTYAVAILSRSLPLAMRARVLSILGLLATGFLLFLLFTSNPFDRHLPLPPPDGADLNPLLQDFGLIVHPPLLYMGYVGFAVPFALALATLTTGRIDAAWARWSRPWTNVAWAFLTLGIALGSWWAYYELGWGGWWFWDPVENASFMPWLVGTALIHSLAATEKRGVFKSWTLLLALSAFSLSLLGAFLVRSGVLTSVHAFAVDPGRGLFILVFLALVIGGSLLLYAVKAAGIRSAAGFGWSSREALLLANNLLLAVATGAVLLGTLYPLIYEVATGGAKISVGPPYFNAVFVPVMSLLFAVMALAPYSRWKRTPVRRLLLERAWTALAALALMALATFGLGARFHPLGFALQSVALWLALALLAHWWEAPAAGAGGHGAPGRRRQQLGMALAHLGMAVAILGVSLTTYHSVGKDVRMQAGDRLALGGYDFHLQGLARVQGPNYVADQAEIRVLRDGRELARLYPEKRRYQVSGQIMTEADMDPGIFRDLYVALGEPLGEGAWAVRVQVKPFVRWIWCGALLMAAGGLLSALDRRYRSVRRRQAMPEGAPA